MPIPGVALFVRPNFDSATSYAHYFMDLAAEYAAQNMRVIDLDRAGANKSNIFASLEEEDPIFCVSGDTLIQLSDGRLERVENLDLPMSCLSAEIRGHLKHKNYLKYKGVWLKNDLVLNKSSRNSPAYKLRTFFSEIIATDNHLFFVRSKEPKDGGRATWKRMDEIKLGEKVLITTKISLGKTEKSGLSSEELQAFGFYLGDGTYYKEEKHGTWQVRITTPVEELKKVYIDKFRTFGNVKDKGDRGLLICSKKLVDLIEKLELAHKSPERYIPDWVCKLPNEELMFFIRGYFDADGGGVDIKKGAIKFFSTSKQILEKLKFLLLRFGIVSANLVTSGGEGKEIVIKGKITHNYNTLYQLPICGVDLETFYKEIGCDNPYNRDKIEKIIREKNTPRLRTFYLPYHKKKIKKEVRGWIKRRGISRINEAFSFATVVSIEKTHSMKVYDLSVKRNHNFIANGFIAHNCYLNGHGNADTFTAQNAEVVMVTCSGDESLIGRVVLLLSCSCGIRLAPSAVSKGATTVFGWVVDFTWIATEAPATDPYARGFFESVNAISNALAYGKTTQEAMDLSLASWNSWIDYWASSVDPYASMVIQWLIHDRDGQKLFGSTSARITTPEPPPPEPPPEVVERVPLSLPVITGYSLSLLFF